MIYLSTFFDVFNCIEIFNFSVANLLNCKYINLSFE